MEIDKQQIEELSLEYIEKNCTPERRDEIKHILQQQGIDIQELDELADISEKLDQIPLPDPSEEMTAGFYNKLNEYSRSVQKQSSWIDRLYDMLHSRRMQKYSVRLAYSFILLFAGWAAGHWLTPDSRIEQMSGEINQMKEMVTLTLLTQQSPSDRIKAVNHVNDLDKIDQKIITALLSTLNTDPNVNVRLVTVEALLEFADIPEVRQGLVQSISRQNSPLVQLALAESMAALQEKAAVSPLQKLLEKKDLVDSVREQIEKSLQTLI